MFSPIVVILVSLIAAGMPTAHLPSMLHGQPVARTFGQSPLVVADTASDLPLFETEIAAQKHCPKDIVVWLNLKTGIYHLKGERWYGNTKYGAYVCKKEADAAGDRETENGQ
jgi:hypothetical protein